MLSRIVLVVPIFVPSICAGPAITAVQNAAGNIAFNAPLAQGSIFVIKGSGLGPADISIASVPFQETTLNGTSVAVTVGSNTVNALMYYTSANQVAALLPSKTPTGTASFAVTYNGQTSASVNQAVVSSNVGLFTIDSSGQGPGIVTFPDYSLVSSARSGRCGGPNTVCGAANPGDTLVLWATGMGPVGGDDAAGAGLGQNMPNVPVKLWLGGVQGAILYQGRSGCCVGEDQIVFTVPSNVPTGCAVPLVVQIDSLVSNTTLMPVANGSRSCTPTNPALANAEQAIIAGPISFASITLSKDFNSNGRGYHDSASFTLAKIQAYNPGVQPFVISFVDDQPLGTCIVFSTLHPNPNIPAANLADADGGSSFTVKGPAGSAVIAGNPGAFTGVLSTTGTFLVPGSFTVSGSGGADIGAFTAQVTIPSAPTLTSPASSSNLTVTRSAGMPLTWRGGDPSGIVQIVVQSAADQGFTTGSTVECNVAANAGTFTIPSYALLALPAGNLGTFIFVPGTVESGFSAAGLDAGILQAFNDFTSFAGFVVK